MKSNNNPNRSGLVRKSLGVLTILGLMALAFGAGTYSDLNRKIELGQHDAKMLEQLTQAARVNLLLQEISKGHVTEVRESLSMTLTDCLAQASVLATNSNPGTASQAKCTLEQFAKDQKAHPEYYMVSLRPRDIQSTHNPQIARQDSKL